MKLSFLTIPIFSLSFATFVQAASIKHFIRQTELDPSVFPAYYEDIEVSAPVILDVVQGSTPAKFPISKWGSRFDLYTTVSSESGDELVRVASSVVGPFPTVSINVITEDDGTVNENWTRADKRFGIDVTIDGISSDPNAPATFKKVIVHHIFKEYEEDSYSFEGSVDTDSWSSAKIDGVGNEVNAVYTGNDTYPQKVGEDGGFTGLHVLSDDEGSPDSPYAKGEERVIVYVIDADGVTEQPMLEETVRIFPKHFFEIRGSFSGNTNDSFILSPNFDADSDTENVYTKYSGFPDIIASLSDIYPKSVIRMELREGKLDEDEEISDLGAVLATTSEITNSTNAPTNNSLIIRSDDISDNPDGFYTAVIVYSTPFSKEQEEVYSGIEVDRSVKVNANISTSE